MQTLLTRLGLVELLFLFTIAVFLTITMVRSGADDLYAFRRWLSERFGKSGRAFSVISRPALPYEGDGPGTYHVTGVVERTGAATEFDVEAKSAEDAFRKGLERRVSPSTVNKLQEPVA